VPTTQLYMALPREQSEGETWAYAKHRVLTSPSRTKRRSRHCKRRLLFFASTCSVELHSLLHLIIVVGVKSEVPQRPPLRVSIELKGETQRLTVIVYETRHGSKTRSYHSRSDFFVANVFSQQGYVLIQLDDEILHRLCIRTHPLIGTKPKANGSRMPFRFVNLKKSGQNSLTVVLFLCEAH